MVAQRAPREEMRSLTENLMDGKESLGFFFDYLRGIWPFRWFPFLQKDAGHAPFIMSLIFFMVTMFSCSTMLGG